MLRGNDQLILSGADHLTLRDCHRHYVVVTPCDYVIVTTSHRWGYILGLNNLYLQR